MNLVWHRHEEPYEIVCEGLGCDEAIEDSGALVEHPVEDVRRLVCLGCVQGEFADWHVLMRWVDE